jgi:hypothetical protein
MYIGAASAGNALFSGTSVAANDTVIINLSQVLGTGEILRALSGTNAALNLTVSGVENDGPLAQNAMYIADNAITSAKIADGAIVNADINASAAIDKTKISGTAVTVADTGTVTSSMILDGTILNADINTSAAIAQSKISSLTTDLAAKAPLVSPTFTGGNMTVTGTATNVSSTINSPTGYYAMQYFAVNGTNKWHYEVTPSGGSWSLVESGVAARMTVNSGSGVTNFANPVTIPSNPSFYAYHTPSGNAGSGTQAFGVVHTNRGSCYNSSNGRFTASVAGNYLFVSSLLSVSTGIITAELQKNGVLHQYGESSRGSGTAGYVQTVFCSIMNMAVGDYATIYTNSYSVYGYSYSSFSGFLIG